MFYLVTIGISGLGSGDWGVVEQQISLMKDLHRGVN
jgi:hypothetical protein